MFLCFHGKDTGSLFFRLSALRYPKMQNKSGNKWAYDSNLQHIPGVRVYLEPNQDHLTQSWCSRFGFKPSAIIVLKYTQANRIKIETNSSLLD